MKLWCVRESMLIFLQTLRRCSIWSCFSIFVSSKLLLLFCIRQLCRKPNNASLCGQSEKEVQVLQKSVCQCRTSTWSALSCKCKFCENWWSCAWNIFGCCWCWMYWIAIDRHCFFLRVSNPSCSMQGMVKQSNFQTQFLKKHCKEPFLCNQWPFFFEVPVNYFLINAHALTELKNRILEWKCFLFTTFSFLYNFPLCGVSKKDVFKECNEPMMKFISCSSLFCHIVKTKCGRSFIAVIALVIIQMFLNLGKKR